jgi:hypothetical protein
MTAEDINTINLEEKAYQSWVREQKNRILAMSNVQKKQAAWRLLFPQVEHSEGWELTVSMF